jgi:TonB family protein
MGEETISEPADAGGQTIAVSASAIAEGMRGVAAGSEDVTVAARDIDDTPPPTTHPGPAPPAPGMPRAVRVAAAKTLPPVPLQKPAEDDSPQTVSIKAVRAGEIPVPPGRSPAPAAPPAPRPAAPAAAVARSSAQPAAAAAAPAAAEPEARTVVLKAAAPPARQMTPRPAAARPQSPEAPAGPTVVMGATEVPRRQTTPPSRPPAARAAQPPPPDAGSRVSPTRKGPPLAVILGGAGLLLLVGAIAAGVVVYRKFAGSVPQEVRPPAPPPTAAPVRARTRTPAPVAVGTIHVVSEPAGAAITVDGQPRGVTPAYFYDVPYGAHEVKVELKGYAPTVETVLISSDAPSPSLSLALSRTAPPTGAAEIASEPAGATVRIDGTPVGQTPFADPKMKTGTHRVEVVKDGFEPWTGTLTVQAGKRARVDARLRAAALAAATPDPDAADVNRIYVNSPAEVDTPARKVSGMSASYPTDRAARLKSGNSVSVRLSFVVTETGEVTDVRVVESAGRLVDEAVLSAVRTWKYSAAVKNGTKVKVRVDFRQTFRAS